MQLQQVQNSRSLFFFLSQFLSLYLSCPVLQSLFLVLSFFLYLSLYITLLPLSSFFDYLSLCWPCLCPCHCSCKLTVCLGYGRPVREQRGTAAGPPEVCQYGHTWLQGQGISSFSIWTDEFESNLYKLYIIIIRYIHRYYSISGYIIFQDIHIHKKISKNKPNEMLSLYAYKNVFHILKLW